MSSSSARMSWGHQIIQIRAGLLSNWVRGAEWGAQIPYCLSPLHFFPLLSVSEITISTVLLGSSCVRGLSRFSSAMVSFRKLHTSCPRLEQVILQHNSHGISSNGTYSLSRSILVVMPVIAGKRWEISKLRSTTTTLRHVEWCLSWMHGK
jgi:hypothetical protein